jgi:hypothetical protein
MSSHDYLSEIIHGAEVYFRSFALADSIAMHDGDIEWIAPKPGFKGPAFVYKASIPDMTERVIERLLPDLRNGNIPSVWVLTPFSEPQNLPEILIANGFKEITNKEQPEYGMALDLTLGTC